MLLFCTYKSDCYLQDETEAENMALLERVNAAGKIYMIGSEFHGDEEREPVTTTAPEQMPPQCGVEWTRLPLEHSGSTGHARRNWRFYLRFAVCHENACSADADFAFRAIVDALESKPLPSPSRPPSTSSPDAAAPGVSTTSAGLPSAESLCAKLLSAFKS